MTKKLDLHPFSGLAFTLFALFILSTSSIAHAINIDLRWDANNTPPDGYRVFARRADQSYDYSKPSWSGSTTSCTIAGLDDQTDYCFVVRAFVGGVESADSNEVVHIASASSGDEGSSVVDVTDTTAPSWDGASAGIGLAEDNGEGGEVKIEFDTAKDANDGTNLKFNVYYDETDSWNDGDWNANSVISNATVTAGTNFTHATTVSGLANNVSYTFGVRVEDQSGNEDQTTNTLNATPTIGSADTGNELVVTYSAVASSIESSSLGAANAVDGNSRTRWASASSDDEWIYVDLGGVYSVGQVSLVWETAYAAQYAIQVSTDATNWNTVHTEYGGNGGQDTISFAAANARFVRMRGIKRATQWGYSLYEFSVYGISTKTDSQSVLTTLLVNPSGTTVGIGDNQTFTASGFDQYGNPLSVVVSWSVNGGGSINAQGVFVASTDGGPFTVKAEAEGVIGTASVTVGAIANSLSELAPENAVASSFESSSLNAVKAVDGDAATRWASDTSDNEWIYVDLGSTYPVERVVLRWETAYASQYLIQVSSNATSWTTVYTENSGNGGEDVISFTSADARYVRMQGLQRATQWGYSLYEFSIYGGEPSQSFELSAVASSIESSSLNAAKAVDGDTATRWASGKSDNEWIYVDLGSTYPVERVVLLWETAYASQYLIQVSSNATSWTTVYTENSGNGGKDDISFTSADARYVRMQGLQRATQWGYSLYEFSINP